LGRVLIVDDNVDAAKSLQVLLRSRGNEVRLAHDGMTAVEVAQQFCPHAVFLDIGLPDMDGFEVARMLRGQQRLAQAMIVALTGYGSDGDCKRAIAAGCNHFLRKPVGIAELDRLWAAHATASVALTSN
jgi:CheY-like chemotaxis protein